MGWRPRGIDNTHANRIKPETSLIAPEIDDIFYSLRKARNRAAHEGYGSPEDAVILLEMARKLGGPGLCGSGDWDYQPTSFEVPPHKQLVDPNLYLKKTKAQIQAWQKQQAAAQQKPETGTGRKKP